jgi:hypothetical protein
MPRLPLYLCVILVLPRPEPARAGIPVLVVPAAVRAGERVEIRWDNLPASAQEVELELSLDGGRWVRISPELEAHERHFLWSVPPTGSAGARLRLRAGGSDAGGDFEDEVTVSDGFRIECSGPAIVGRPGALDWWQVGSRSRAPGWEHALPEVRECGECGLVVAGPDTRSQTLAPATARESSRVDNRIAGTEPRPANAGHTATRGRPLRL